MVSNLRFGYPAIPFDCLSITSSETYSTTKPVLNLVNGSKGKIAELATTMIGQHEIEFDLGSGISQACDYLALSNAKILKGSGVTQVQLKGSSASYRSPASISGLIAWIDPTKDVTYSSARGISQVNDQSGNGNHATDPASATNRPTYSRADNKENLNIYSYDFGNSSYSSDSLTSATSGAVADSNGEMNGTTLLAANANSRHGRYITSTPSGGATSRPVIYSVEIKKGNYQFAWVGDRAHSSWHGVCFDFDTAALGTQASLTSATKEALSDGWYKITIAYNVSDTGSCTCGVYFCDTNTRSSPPAFLAAGTEIMHVAHAHFRNASADSTYIETEAGSQPAGINGNRCMVFDGSNDYLACNGIAASLTGSDAPFTISVVVKLNTTSVTSTPWSVGRSSTATPLHRIDLRAGNYDQYRRDDAATLVSISSGAPTTNLTLITAVFAGTTTSLYVDGASLYTGTACNVTGLTLDRFGIGSIFNTSTSQYFNGKMGDLMVFNSALSDANRQTVEAYLTSKWSTTAAATIAVDTLTLTGGQGKDYITTFTETTAYRYWILQFESDLTTTRPLSKAYFGKLFDFGRDPEFTSPRSQKQRTDKSIYQAKTLTLNYKGITNTKREEFETKIGDFVDGNHIILHTGTYDNLLMGNDVLTARIISYEFTHNGASQNDLTMTIEEIV